MSSQPEEQEAVVDQDQQVEEPDFLEGAEAADPESFNVCISCD